MDTVVEYYTEITNNIKVSVRPFYIKEQSFPDKGHFTWSYNIHVENLGSSTVKLLNRYWKITDGNGIIREVRGAGVVGEQPSLKPGQKFEYTSGTHLPTPTGIMSGYYEMLDDDGTKFNIIVPAFSLDSPEMLMKPN